MRYKKLWAGRDLSPEQYRILSGFALSLTKAEMESEVLFSHNQFLVSTKLAGSDIAGYHPAISTLRHETGLSSSSLYSTLGKMEEAGLVEFYSLPNDNRRKYVRAKKSLYDEYLNYLDRLNSLAKVLNMQLDDSKTG